MTLTEQLDREKQRLQELEHYLEQCMRHPKNPFWDCWAKMFILSAPKRKRKVRKQPLKALQYKYAQRMAEILIDKFILNPIELNFVAKNLQGTPAGDKAGKQLKEIHKR